MNYQRIYNDIVESAKNRSNAEGYYEKHHIVPKCMGGTNQKDNIVLLTAKEHFICHKLLVRIFPDVRGNWYALIAMGRLSQFKSKIFESERKKAAQMRVGFKYSDESRSKMSISAKKRGMPENSKHTQFGKKPAWNKGLKDWRKGYVHSSETRAKLSAAMLAKGVIPPSRLGAKKTSLPITP